MTLDEGAIVQNIPPSTSWPNEGMSEQYSSINTFSQLLTVIFQSDDLSSYDIYKEFNYCSFILQRGITDDLDAEF